MRSIATKLALAAAVTIFAASSAAADDGRRHVMTPSQKIDMVRDLPDIGAFEKDGLHYDLGYIYPIHIVNGASVAGGSGETGFVLYNDDRYIRADSRVMHDLEFVLGEDPTQGYTPPRTSGGTAAADPWGVNGSSDAAKGEPIASPSARASRRGGGVGLFGALFFLFIILFARVRLFRDLVIAGMLAGIAAIVRRRSEPDFSTGRDVGPARQSSQAAAQLARLDSLSAAPVPSPGGGFGRKGV